MPSKQPPATFVHFLTGAKRFSVPCIYKHASRKQQNLSVGSSESSESQNGAQEGGRVSAPQLPLTPTTSSSHIPSTSSASLPLSGYPQSSTIDVSDQQSDFQFLVTGNSFEDWNWHGLLHDESLNFGSDSAQASLVALTTTYPGFDANIHLTQNSDRHGTNNEDHSNSISYTSSEPEPAFPIIQVSTNAQGRRSGIPR